LTELLLKVPLDTKKVIFETPLPANHTRSPAVARMADRTDPVVKLTLDGVSAHATAAKRAIIWQKGISP